MKRKFFTSVNISLIVLIIAIITVSSVAFINAKSDKMAGENYMTSDNLSKIAKISGDIFNSKKISDGKNGTSSTMRKKNNAEIILDFGSEKAINSVILKEEGLNCLAFEIAISTDNLNYTTVHKSDKIEYQRLCTFPNTIGRYIKLTILEAKNNVTLREIEVYNEAKRDDKEFRVCGYYSTDWASVWLDSTLNEEEKQNKTDSLIIDYNMDNLTNLFMYCGVSYNSAGEVFMSENSSENTQLKAALLNLIGRLKTLSKNNIKLSLTLGAGTGNQTFLTAINANKINFIKNLIAFCNELGFDGIDIDYEFPVSQTEYALFDAFLIELKENMINKMDVKEYALLSCAFGTMDITYSEKARQALDMVNCMTYDIFDQDGQHSSFWGGCVQGAKYLESVGFSKSQINIGIPFYGTQVDALMEQYLYCNLPYNDYYQNEYVINDYLGKPTRVYFNSPSISRDKTAYALLAGYGGVMSWHSTIDIKITEKNSLWRAINSAVSDFGGGL